VKVDRNFAKGSRLRYQVSVYNATRVGDSSSVSLQVQVLRGSQTILTLPAKEVTKRGVRDLASAGDAQLLASIPSSGELELGQLPPGWYVLQITATDKVSKRSVSQEANFVVY
jgi:hypothetical protein